MESALWQRYQNENVVVWGIAVDEPVEVIDAFINEFQLTFPILQGNAQLKSQYRVGTDQPISPFPRDFIIGPDGFVAYAADVYDPEAMIATIEDLLDPSTSVIENDATPPNDFNLVATYPNPASISQELSSGKVNIVYELSKAGEIAMQVFDVRGRLVRTFTPGLQSPGAYTIQWDGQSDGGLNAASGTYFIRLQAGNFQQIKKISLIR